MMGLLEDRLHEFRQNSARLIEAARLYTIPYDNVRHNALAGFIDVRSDYALPFSSAILRLEQELLRLRNALKHGDAEEIYECTAPAFRVTRRLLSEDTHEEIIDYDSITKYMHAHQIMVAFARNPRICLSGNPYQEAFILDFIRSMDRIFPSIHKERLADASPELKEAYLDCLGNMQEMYKFNPENVFVQYSGLLVRMHQALHRRGDVNPQYQGLKPRRIPQLSSGVVSNFVGSEFIELDQEGTRVLRELLNESRIDTERKAILIGMLLSGGDWKKHLPDIAEYLHFAHQDILDKHKCFEYYGPGRYESFEISNIRRECIIGQDDNVYKLYQLLTGFARGASIPNIVLLGDGGTGKTLTMQAVANEVDGLRMFIIGSRRLESIAAMGEELGKLPRHSVIYVDDIHLHPSIQEDFKTGTEGMKTWPPNVIIAGSCNPESYELLPDSVKRRFPIVLKYGKLDLSSDSLLDRVFRANCAMLGIGYNPRWVSNFAREKADCLKSIAPSEVSVYLRMQHALDAAKGE